MPLTNVRHNSATKTSSLKVRSSSTVGAERQSSIIAFLILLIGGLSFLAQPVGYRPAGIPMSLTLVAFFNIAWLVLEFRAKLPNILLFGAFPVFLILTDMMIGFDTRGTILALLLVFCYFGSALRLSDTQLRWLWTALAWVAFFLALLGLYRYLNGYVAPKSENEGGIADLDQAYFYLGIAYLPSTRNSDAFYFVVGLVAALRLALRPGAMASIYIGLVMFQSLVIALTLSRGAYLAALVAAFLLLKRRQRSKAAFITVGATMIGLAVVSSSSGLDSNKIKFVYSLIENAVVSIFDQSSANQSVSGYYTYSNDIRMDLYIETLQSFLAFPFGQGMDNVHFGTPGNHTIRLHSENLYLDFLIIFGVFSSVLFFYVWRIFIHAIRLRKASENARMGLAVLSACAVFALFNSPVNLVVFWFTLVLGLAEVNRSVLLAKAGKIDAAASK